MKVSTWIHLLPQTLVHRPNKVVLSLCTSLRDQTRSCGINTILIKKVTQLLTIKPAPINHTNPQVYISQSLHASTIYAISAL